MLSPQPESFITDNLYNYSHNDKVVLDIVEKLEGEKSRKSHRTTIEHAGFFTPTQVLSLLISCSLLDFTNSSLVLVFYARIIAYVNHEELIYYYLIDKQRIQ